MLARFLERPIDRRGGTVGDILAAGAAQLLFLGVPAHAVVNTATALADTDRAGHALKPVVNAVLRRVAAEGPAMVAAQDEARMVLPDWLAARWTAAYGEAATKAIASLHLVEPPLDLSVPADTAAWATRLGGTVPVPGTVRLERAGRITRLAGFDEGAWWVQDAAAAVPVRILGPVAGLDVIDLCAAPGGKTAGLAAAGAHVTAVDHDARRMARLGDNLTRLRLTAETVVADAREWRPEAPADIVLVDAPCSATGIMRRHPDILRRRKPEDLRPLAGLQARLLAAAVDMAKPGGRVVYCTCSLEPEEGEGQIERAIADLPVARAPIEAADAAGFALSLTAEGDLRILPTALAPAGGCDGFFVAVLNKLAANQAARC